jgi:hypothetical protein
MNEVAMPPCDDVHDCDDLEDSDDVKVDLE